jgi:hypothetical protein
MLGRQAFLPDEVAVRIVAPPKRGLTLDAITTSLN